MTGSSVLISDENRSLGLCLPESFSFSFAMNRSGSNISVRTVLLSEAAAILIGVHTMPELDVLIDWGRL